MICTKTIKTSYPKKSRTALLNSSICVSLADRQTAWLTAWLPDWLPTWLGNPPVCTAASHISAQLLSVHATDDSGCVWSRNHCWGVVCAFGHMPRSRAQTVRARVGARVGVGVGDCRVSGVKICSASRLLSYFLVRLLACDKRMANRANLLRASLDHWPKNAKIDAKRLGQTLDANSCRSTFNYVN